MKAPKIVPGDWVAHRATRIAMKVEAVDYASRTAYCSWKGRHGAEREAYYGLEELDLVTLVVPAPPVTEAPRARARG
jgi:hypothetical protein